MFHGELLLLHFVMTLLNWKDFFLATADPTSVPRHSPSDCHRVGILVSRICTTVISRLMKMVFHFDINTHRLSTSLLVQRLEISNFHFSNKKVANYSPVRFLKSETLIEKFFLHRNEICEISTMSLRNIKKLQSPDLFQTDESEESEAVSTRKAVNNFELVRKLIACLFFAKLDYWLALRTFIL